MPTETTFPVRLFCSYSHKNEDFRASMENSLSLLHRRNLIIKWSDHDILPGRRISDAVKKEMRAADIFVFLLSFDFISSDSCMKEWEESKQFVKFDKPIRIPTRIPIILTACPWQDLLGDDDIKALPKDGHPISSYSDQSIAWNEIYEEIKSVVESIRSNFSPQKEFLNHVEEVVPDTAPPSWNRPTANRAMRGKYAPLYRYLTTRTGLQWQTSFGEIETVLGFDLPASARRHRPWWANEDGGGHSHARAWREAGWRTRDVNLRAETLVFERVGDVSSSW